MQDNNSPLNEPDDSIDGALDVAFGPRPESQGALSESVLQVLRTTTGAVAQINLRDIQDEESPLVRPSPSSPPQNTVLPPQIGHFQVVGEIARGGVGAILKARDLDIGRDIAIKVLLDAHKGNAELTRRFVEEAQIGGQLQHPGIVAIHEMGLFADNKPYFAMKLVKGRTLSAHLEERKDASDERQRFLGIFEQVCQTLAYAHARGVIHRDLKPSNVMVGTFGEVQVMDWGLAKVLSQGGRSDDRLASREAPKDGLIKTIRSEKDGSNSLAGSVMGTPAYMAPEQARGAVDRIDERTDVFGLGAILCEILTGLPPYVGKNPEEIYAKAKNGILDYAMERLDSCGADDEVIRLAKDCLALEPRKRPRHAKVVAKALGAYLASLEERKRALEVRAAKARFKMYLAVTVLLAFILGGGFYLWNISESRARASRATGEVIKATDEAQRLWVEASQTAVGKLPRLKVALAEAEKALALATPEEVDERERIRARTLHADLAATVRDQLLLEKLEDIRTDLFQGKQWWEIDREYDRTFRDFGIDVTDPALSPAEVARQIEQHPDLKESLALALDYWWMARHREDGHDPQVSDKLSKIALEVADDGSLEKSLSRFFLTHDFTGLEESTTRERQTASAPALSLMAENFVFHNRRDQAETVLREAVKRYPGDFWINCQLGQKLCRDEPPRWLESLRYLTAATALRPESSVAWRFLGTALFHTGDVEGALDSLRNAVDRAPLSEAPYLALLDIFERANFPTDTEGFPELVRWLDGRLRAGEPLHTLAARVVVVACTLEPDLLDARRSLGLILREVQASGRRDAEGLDLLARLQFALGNRREAVRTLEEASDLPDGRGLNAERLAGYRASLYPDLASFASIDAMFDDLEPLFDPAVDCRYMPGVREPSSGLEWTRAEFDDGSWKVGRSPFENSDDKDVSWTTLYVRRAFEVPPGDSRYRRYFLSVDTDHGCVAYLNGVEVGRVRAGGRGIRRPFWAHCDGRGRGISGKVASRFEIPRGLVRSGLNVLALQGLRRNLGRRLPLVGVVGGELEPELERRRFEPFQATIAGPDRAARLAYLEGRFLQRLGDHRRAAERFRRVLDLDRSLPEPFLRLWESLAASEDRDTARRLLGETLETDPLPDRLLPIAPETPVNARPRGTASTADGAFLLEAEPFFSVDPRFRHRSSHWQLRGEGMDYDLNPVFDGVSEENLTACRLPQDLLRPRTTYYWRVSFADDGGRESNFSEETAFTTGDFHFEAVPFDLSAHFNADVVSSPDDRDDGKNDHLGIWAFRLIVDGFDGTRTDSPHVRGLPLDRRIGVHRLADFGRANAVKLPKWEKAVRIEAPRHGYTSLRFLVTSSEGDALLPAILEYEDGSSTKVWIPSDDLFDDPVPDGSRRLHDGASPVWNGMDWTRGGKLDDTNDPALFEVIVPVAADKQLVSVLLEPAQGRYTMPHLRSSARGHPGTDSATTFHLFAITGVRVEP